MDKFFQNMAPFHHRLKCIWCSVEETYRRHVVFLMPCGHWGGSLDGEAVNLGGPAPRHTTRIWGTENTSDSDSKGKQKSLSLRKEAKMKCRLVRKKDRTRFQGIQTNVNWEGIMGLPKWYASLIPGYSQVNNELGGR